MRRAIRICVLACIAGLTVGGAATPRSAQAAEVRTSRVTAGGVSAVLLLPAKPVASLILLTGGPGRVGIDEYGGVTSGGGNQLVRTRDAYAAKGFAVLVPDVGFDLSALVTTMAAIKRPVTVVGTSRGTQRAAKGLAAGAKPDRLVLTSGFLAPASGPDDTVMSILGDPSRLPPTLVVHHRSDGCRVTRPEGVEPFKQWAGSRVTVRWLDGGTSEGNPCEAFAHHGFNGLDGAVVSAVAGFARR